MGKNAGQTVQALLAKAPAPPRAHTPVPAEPAVEADLREGEHAPAAEASTELSSAAIPVVPARARRRRRLPRSEEVPPAEPTAPPTLRLSQPIAEALRTAWLTAKRDRVLLTYQDFAGEVIATGLRGGVCGPAAAKEAKGAEGAQVPRTLRLSQPIAEALRTAWLTAKRDRVLLTYQDFAGEIIATGLRQLSKDS